MQQYENCVAVWKEKKNNAGVFFQPTMGGWHQVNDPTQRTWWRHKADTQKSLQEEILCRSAHETLMSHSQWKKRGPRLPSPPLRPHPPANHCVIFDQLYGVRTALTYCVWSLSSREPPVFANAISNVELIPQEKTKNKKTATMGGHLTDDRLGKLHAVGLNNLDCSPWWPISACRSINWNPERFHSCTGVCFGSWFLAGKTECLK